MLRKQFKAVGLSALLALSGAVRADLNAGLLAHWSFDDCSAKDVTGSGYDGTLSGPLQCINGVHDKALSFVTSGEVQIPALPAVFNNGFSGCAWASYKDNNPWATIFDFANGAGIDNILLQRNYTSNKAAYTYEFSPPVITGGAIINNQWQLFCVTVNNTTHTANLYVNSKAVATNKSHKIENVIRASNFLGIDNWNEQFHGKLDEVRIWKRALSAFEITQLYHRESPLAGSLRGTGSYTVTCTNTVTDQSVTLPAQTAAKWDCSEAGLLIGPKESYNISIDGIAD